MATTNPLPETNTLTPAEKEKLKKMESFLKKWLTAADDVNDKRTHVEFLADLLKDMDTLDKGLVDPPFSDLKRALDHVAALEEYIYRINTCVACDCSLCPGEDPPHCEDGCHPDEEQQIDWVDAYLEDPVGYFRKKFTSSEVLVDR